MGAIIFLIGIVWLISSLSKKKTYKPTPLKKVNIPHYIPINDTVEWYSFQPYTFSEFEEKYKNTKYYGALLISPPAEEDLLSGQYTETGTKLLSLEKEIKDLQNEIEYAKLWDRGTKQREERLSKKILRREQMVSALEKSSHLTSVPDTSKKESFTFQGEYEFFVSCPYCAKEISSLSEVCYHCGKALYVQNEV